MGIVFSHTIVSLFLHYRNRHRYDAQLQDDSDQTSIPERLADQVSSAQAVGVNDPA